MNKKARTLCKPASLDPLEQSIKERCSCCSREVWVSAKSLDQAKQCGAEILCGPCALSMIDKLEESPTFALPGESPRTRLH